MNLTSAQLDGLKDNKDVDLIEGTSLDFVYMTLTSGKELSPALAIKEARQAIAYAIDYDGMIQGLEGGFATRPPSFIPNGLGGATSELTKEIGYRHDPDKAKSLLAKAGLAQGFSFDLYYGDASVAGTTYQLVAQKLQSDLAAVNITANLHPLDQSTARSKFRAAELPSFITFWNPDGPEPWTWASATVQRVAKRVRWTGPPLPAVTELVNEAGAAHSPEEQNRYYRQYMEALIDQAQLHRSLPAGLSGRHPHQHQGLEADGRGMAGRSLRRPSGLSRRTSDEPPARSSRGQAGGPLPAGRRGCCPISPSVPWRPSSWRWQRRWPYFSSPTWCRPIRSWPCWAISRPAIPKLSPGSAPNGASDQSLVAQYWIFLDGLFHGDLGVSIVTRRGVLDDILQYAPATFELATAAALLVVIVGLPLGILASIFRDRWVDHVARIVSLIGVAAPTFWLAFLALALFYGGLQIAPSPGRLGIGDVAPPHVTGFYTIDALLPATMRPSARPSPISSCRPRCWPPRPWGSSREPRAPACWRLWARITCGWRARRGSSRPR